MRRCAVRPAGADLVEFIRRETDMAWDHKYKRCPP
jgi:hypothetical protein